MNKQLIEELLPSDEEQLGGGGFVAGSTISPQSYKTTNVPAAIPETAPFNTEAEYTDRPSKTSTNWLEAGIIAEANDS